VLEDQRGPARDGPASGIGGRDRGWINAGREHRSAARARRPKRRATTVLGREAQAPLLVERQDRWWLDGAAAVFAVGRCAAP
jgi:hypothetical protein